MLFFQDIYMKVGQVLAGLEFEFVPDDSKKCSIIGPMGLGPDGEFCEQGGFFWTRTTDPDSFRHAIHINHHR